MSKRAWVGLSAAALVIALAGGGYALLLSSVNDAVERSFAQFRASLPPGAVFTHGPYDVDLLARSVTLASPAVDFNGYGGMGVLSAAEAVVLGLEPDEGETRAGQIVLTTVSLNDPAGSGDALTVESVEARDVVISGEPADLRQGLLATTLGSLQANDFALATDELVFSLQALTLTEMDRGRLGGFGLRDFMLDVEHPTDDALIVAQSLSMSGLDLSDMLLQAEAAEAIDWRLGLLAAELESFQADGLEIGSETLSIALGDLQIADVAEGRLGAFRMSDLLAEQTGPLNPGKLTVDSFSLASVDLSPFFTLPSQSLDGLSDMEAFELGFEFGMGLAQTLTGFALEGVRLETPNLGSPVEMAALRLSDPQVVDGVVVGGLSELEALSFPFDPGISAQARRLWSLLELEDRLVISATADQRYDAETESLLAANTITLHDMLELEVAFRLGNLDAPIHAGLSEADLQVALLAATLGEAELVLSDLGLLRPAIEVFASESGLSPEELVGQFMISGAEVVRAFQIGPAGLEALRAAETFMLEAGSFQIVLAPAEEVPLLLLGIAETPADTLELLNPSFTAQPN